MEIREYVCNFATRRCINWKPDGSIHKLRNDQENRPADYRKVKQLLVFNNMRFSIILYLFSICITTYSQDRICFIDSLDFSKDEIEKLENFNLKKMKRLYPVYRQYSNLIQLHFFCLHNMDIIGLIIKK